MGCLYVRPYCSTAALRRRRRRTYCICGYCGNLPAIMPSNTKVSAYLFSSDGLGWMMICAALRQHISAAVCRGSLQRQFASPGPLVEMPLAERQLFSTIGFRCLALTDQPKFRIICTGYSNIDFCTIDQLGYSIFTKLPVFIISVEVPRS